LADRGLIRVQRIWNDTPAAVLNAPSDIHSVFDKRATGSFNNSCCNRQSVTQVLVIPHHVGMSQNVPGRFINPLSLLEPPFRRRRSHACRYSDGAAVQNTQQTLTNPILYLGITFTEEAPGSVPEVLGDVNDVEDYGNLNLTGYCLTADRLDLWAVPIMLPRISKAVSPITSDAARSRFPFPPLGRERRATAHRGESYPPPGGAPESGRGSRCAP